jgi:hypothetical protein
LEASEQSGASLFVVRQMAKFFLAVIGVSFAALVAALVIAAFHL